jgi:micrococcal nuclease
MKKTSFEKPVRHFTKASMTARQNRARLILAALSLLVLFLLCACETGGDAGEGYTVTRVVDGDTIIIDMDGAEERVRLIGVDTPESVHPDESRNVPYGEIASKFTKERLEGRKVEIELDTQERDRYGRILAYVYIDGEMFNKALLSEGHAQISTYPPNVRYVDEFTLLQQEARNSGAGLWAYYDSETPDETGKYTSEPTTRSERDRGAANTNGYIGNAGTKKFHLPSCRHVSSIKDVHIVNLATRDEAVAGGFAACKTCNP